MVDIHVSVIAANKRFGAIRALQDVSVDLARGQVHALVGENGAGKSTLGRVIAGVHAPDSGSVHVDGRPVRFAAPRDALAHGITMIAQELMLVPQRSVLENVFLGTEISRAGFVARRDQLGRYRELAELAGFDLDPLQRVDTLRLADQQKVEILRALARDAQLIVMDEPTAALSAVEVDRLLQIIRRLRDAGTTVVFVSHFLDQVLAVADTVTVLRDGQLVDHGPAQLESTESIVTKMLGREVGSMFPERAPVEEDAPVVLEIRGLTRRGVFNDVDLQVRAGEIVGIGGLVGAGRSELLRAIFGADAIDAGRVVLDGEPVVIKHPRDAVARGMALIPESRKDDGLLLEASIRRNIVLPHLGALSTRGWLTAAGESLVAGAVADQVGVRGAVISKSVASLSGGNQQKVMFAKWLVRPPRVLMIDEPTRGVDVGARQTIYELIGSLAKQGVAVLVVSSDAEEVLSISHRVLVMRLGEVVSELRDDDMREDALLSAAFGAKGVSA